MWCNVGVADIQLTCATINAATKDLDGKIEYQEFKPSHFSVLSEDLGNNEVIVRLFPNLLETGSMSSPFLGIKSDSSLAVKYNNPYYDDTYKTLRIDRISGQFTYTWYIGEDWFRRSSGECWAEKKKF